MSDEIKGKMITYKKVKLFKPDNISMNLIKAIIDKGGFSLQEVVDLLSSVIVRIKPSYNNGNTKSKNS